MIQHSYPFTTPLQTLGRKSQTSALPNTELDTPESKNTTANTSVEVHAELSNRELSVQTVLATLATLTQQAAFQHGWLLLIAPPWQLTKSMLEQAGIQSQRILLIPQRQISRFDNLMRDALTCATCSAVVSFLAAEQTELEDYRYLSAKYGTPLLNMTTDLPTQNLFTH